MGCEPRKRVDVDLYDGRVDGFRNRFDRLFHQLTRTAPVHVEVDEDRRFVREDFLEFGFRLDGDRAVPLCRPVLLARTLHDGRTVTT